MREVMPNIILNKPVLVLMLTAISVASAAAADSPVTGSAIFGVDAAETSTRKSAAETYTLDQAVDYALTNNPDLQIAIERIKQAEARLGMALSAFYPQISARASYEHSNNPAQVFAMIVAQRDFDANAMQSINSPGYRQNFRPEIIGTLSIFRGGQDYQRSKAAELGIDAAEFERSTVRNALVEAVTVSYYAYLTAQEAMKVAQDSIHALSSELKQTKIRFEAGTTLKSEVLSLDVKLAEAKEAEIRAANAIELSKISMANLLGLENSAAFSVAPASKLTRPSPTASFDQMRELALTGRPEIMAAARQVEISERELKVEMGAYLPKADAYVSYGQNSQSPGFSGQKDNVTVGVAVEMNLFSGFNIKQRVSAAQQKVKEMRERERKTRLGIEQEVKTAFLKLQEALARLHVAETSQQAAEEALRLVNEERRAGMATITRYIESEVARNKARSSFIAAHYDALSAEMALKKAVGDWK